jgi:hypothetical protein
MTAPQMVAAPSNDTTDQDLAALLLMVGEDIESTQAGMRDEDWLLEILFIALSIDTFTHSVHFFAPLIATFGLQYWVLR